MAYDEVNAKYYKKVNSKNQKKLNEELISVNLKRKTSLDNHILLLNSFEMNDKLKVILSLMNYNFVCYLFT
jgi:hypothetical protein